MERDRIQDCVTSGVRVRELRRAQKIARAQLAGPANTRGRFISDLENGKKTAFACRY